MQRIAKFSHVGRARLFAPDNCDLSGMMKPCPTYVTRFVWVRKSTEQFRVSACPGENNGVARKLVDQQKIAAYVAFSEIGPFPRQFMVAVFGWQGAIVGDQ